MANPIPTAPNKPRFSVVGYIIVFFLVSAIFGFVIVGMNRPPPPERVEPAKYSEFVQDVTAKNVESVKGVLGASEITYQIRHGGWHSVVVPPVDNNFAKELLVKGVTDVNFVAPEAPGMLAGLISNPLWIFLFVFIVYILWQGRQQSAMKRGGPGGAGQADQFAAKSKAAFTREDGVTTKFSDVAGCDEAKEDVAEMVMFLKDPNMFEATGAKPPRGVLLSGPPGTGKTLLARAIAGESNVPFFSMSGSEFVEMFVGVGAARVRDLFREAKKAAPCIIFIDEIDAIGKSRGAAGSGGGGNDEREMTLNQILVEMDGFEAMTGIIIIGATNRPDVLDPGLLRPGRFDRQIVLNLPDLKAREAIFNVHTKLCKPVKPLAPGVSLRDLARGTAGMNGAQIMSICNEAAIFASRAGKKIIDMKDFEKAKDKVLMGSENHTMALTEAEKRQIAYHEAGHAVVGSLFPDHAPVYKVSIIPRGRALGITMFLPERDEVSLSMKKIFAEMCGLFGGRVAEELIYGEDGVCTGAQNDYARATAYAVQRVYFWGMPHNKKLQGRSYAEQGGGLEYLGGRGTNRSAISEETQRLIDEDIRQITQDAYGHTVRMLEEHREKLEVMTDALCLWETIGAPQVQAIMAGKPLEEVPPPEGFGEEMVVVAEVKTEITSS